MEYYEYCISHAAFMFYLPDYRGIHLYAAADECNHNLFEHNQPGLSKVMFGSLVCPFLVLFMPEHMLLLVL